MSEAITSRVRVHSVAPTCTTCRNTPTHTHQIDIVMVGQGAAARSSRVGGPLRAGPVEAVGA